MVTYCDRVFAGPEYTFLDPSETQLVRKTLCEERDCDAVLREVYDVTRCVHVESDDELVPTGEMCEDVLRAIDRQLEECDEGSRVLTDLEMAELAHNELHDESFSILYEDPTLEEAFVLYFEQTRIVQTQSAPKMM